MMYNKPMNIRELFDNKKCVLSFEVFPPKKVSSIDAVYEVLDNLCKLKPDYMSVTYSAGGSDNCLETLRMCSIIKERHNVEPLMHLTCVGTRTSEIESILKDLKNKKINNILALRGDKRDDAVYELKYASELVKIINNTGGFNVVGACYPEGHIECENMDMDIENLKQKVDLGVTHLNTQMFFDNDDFYKFMEKIRKAGIKVPVQAGIMPIVRQNQIDRIVTLAGVKIPSRLSRLIAKYSDNPEALYDAGVAYATEQISDLIAGGTQGIHLYVMNKYDVAKRITDNVRNLLNS